MPDIRPCVVALLLSAAVHPLDSASIIAPGPDKPAQTCRPSANRGFCRVGCHIVPVIVRRSAPTLDRVAQPYPTGTVILEAGVAANGHVVSVCVLRSVRPDFDRAAQAAASRWLFKPSFLDGKPVGIVTTLTMDVPAKTAR